MGDYVTVVCKGCGTLIDDQFRDDIALPIRIAISLDNWDGCDCAKGFVNDACDASYDLGYDDGYEEGFREGRGEE